MTATDIEAALLEIIGRLGSALIQQAQSDDKIIMEHVRESHEIAIKLRRKIMGARQ